MIPLTQRFFPPSYCSSQLPSVIPFFSLYVPVYVVGAFASLFILSFVKFYIQSFNNVQLATWGQYRCSNVERNFVYPNEST